MTTLMNYLGTMNAGLKTAPYTIPNYPVANQTAYTFSRNAMAPFLRQNPLMTGATTNAYASLQLTLSGISEVVLNPTGAVGSVFNGVAQLRGYDVSYFGSTVPAPRMLVQHHNQQAPTSEPLSQNLFTFPPGFKLIKQVNIIGETFGMSYMDKIFATQTPAFHWFGSTLDDTDLLYMAVLEDGVTATYYNGFNLNNIGINTIAYSSGTGLTLTHTSNGLVRVFNQKTINHPVLIWEFAPAPYDPIGKGTNTPRFIKTPAFEDAVIQAQFDANNYEAGVWWGGFLFQINTNYLGPTGQRYEIVVTDETMSNYWLVKLIPEDSTARDALLRGAGQWQFKIDVDGSIYFNSGDNLDKNAVFYNFAPLLFDFPSVQLSRLPPITLPCFNPCLATDLSRGIFGD